MLDLIQVGVHAATTYIDNTREAYKKWAKKHNDTLDDSSPVNPDGDFDAESSNDSTPRVEKFAEIREWEA